MRLLITGGCGFLGHHLCEHFYKNTDVEIVVLDKLTYASSGYDRLRDVKVAHPDHDPASRESARMIPIMDTRRVRILGCDIALPIPEGIRQEVGAVDYVIHAAAETHVDNSIVDPLPFLMSNVIGTHHLLMWLRAMPALRRVFMVSTDECYGPADLDDTTNAFSETAPFRPANPYAASKASAENVMMAYSNTYRIPVMIAATMNLVGERQHFEKMVPRCIRAALTGEKLIIHADPTRTKSGTRFYLHCRTYAHALGFLIDEDIKGTTLPIKVNICGEREISNLDLARTIAKHIGGTIDYSLESWHASRPGHDLAYRMRDDLIRSLGWQRPMGIDQSLQNTVQWYLANQHWLGLSQKPA